MQAGGRARPARRGGWHRDRCNPKPQRGRTAQLNAPARRGELGLRGSLDHRSRGRSGRRQTLAERYVACCGGMRRRHLVAKLLAPQRADINVIILQFGELHLHSLHASIQEFPQALPKNSCLGRILSPSSIVIYFRFPNLFLVLHPSQSRFRQRLSVTMSLLMS